MKNKNTKYIVGVIVILAIAGLVYYLTRPGKALAGGMGVMTQAEALEMSKTISNLIETENAANIAKANSLKADMKAAGWNYIDYNSVQAV